MCWCSKAPESPYLPAAAGGTVLSQKNQHNPSIILCVPRYGHGARMRAGRAVGVCGAEVLKPCPAPLSCLCSAAARAADGPSARAAGASVLLFPAVETLSRRCASSAMKN